MNISFNKVIIYALFKKLSLKDLQTCGILNRQFNQVFKLDMLWCYLFERDFGSVMESYREVTKGESAWMIYREYKYLSYLKFQDFIRCRFHKDIKTNIIH